MAKPYFEYRGASDGVYAEILSDTSEGITYGEIKEFAGLGQVGKTTESSNEAHYYDNIPAIIVSSTGADEISLETSGIPLSTVADITGQYFDENTGMFVEMERVPKMFAFGYKTQKTDGTVIYVWRLKGSFTVPEQTSATKDDGTDANGQTLTYTGISTTHAFNKTGASAKSVNIDTSNNPLGITSDEFFATVQTPDTIGETVAVTGVTVTPDTASVTVNSTTTLTATVAPTNASNKAVTWESSDNEVATVVNGVVSGVSAGTATITVTTVDGNFTDTAAITVTSE